MLRKSAALRETFVVAPPRIVSLPVVGSDLRFPINRVYCVGQNYASHAKEMGKARAEPFFFAKPRDAVVHSGATIAYPSKTKNFHYEIELVVAIGKGGSDIPVSQAMGHVYGVAVGIDLTRRDLQKAAKDGGKPWDMSKGFDNSAPCSAVVPIVGNRLPEHFATRTIELAVNGVVKQKGKLGEMVWPVMDIVSFLSGFVELAAGDLIFTGTPEGVGPLVPGDRAVGTIDDIGSVEVLVAPPKSKL